MQNTNKMGGLLIVQEHKLCKHVAEFYMLFGLLGAGKARGDEHVINYNLVPPSSLCQLALISEIY
jgi:hypothetical protein